MSWVIGCNIEIGSDPVWETSPGSCNADEMNRTEVLRKERIVCFQREIRSRIDSKNTNDVPAAFVTTSASGFHETVESVVFDAKLMPRLWWLATSVEASRHVQLSIPEAECLVPQWIICTIQMNRELPGVTGPQKMDRYIVDDYPLFFKDEIRTEAERTAYVEQASFHYLGAAFFFSGAVRLRFVRPSTMEGGRRFGPHPWIHASRGVFRAGVAVRCRPVDVYLDDEIPDRNPDCCINSRLRTSSGGAQY